MGQYHKLVNLDKKEWVDPHGLGLGSKQYEQVGGFDGSLADAMYTLTMSSPASGGGDFPLTDVSGRWCGDRVVIVGDYTQSIPGIDDAEKLYGLASDSNPDWHDLTSDLRVAFTKIFQIDYEEVDYGSFTSWRRVSVEG